MSQVALSKSCKNEQWILRVWHGRSNDLERINHCKLNCWRVALPDKGSKVVETWISKVSDDLGCGVFGWSQAHVFLCTDVGWCVLCSWWPPECNLWQCHRDDNMYFCPEKQPDTSCTTVTSGLYSLQHATCFGLCFSVWRSGTSNKRPKV